VNGNYTPVNCTWIPKKNQNRNRNFSVVVVKTAIQARVTTWLAKVKSIEAAAKAAKRTADLATGLKMYSFRLFVDEMDPSRLCWELRWCVSSLRRWP
jgi:hypothetical protein